MELLNALVSLQQAVMGREGVTTQAGDGGGISIKDTALTGIGVAAFRNAVIVLYPGDYTKVAIAAVTAFNNVSEVTFTPAYKGGQVPAGAPYKILNTTFIDPSSLGKEFQEQADVPVTVGASSAGEVTVLDLSVAATQYIVRNLRLKCGSDPGAETVTVRLYELINDAPILVDTFIITTLNYGTYFSLMDMFGVPELAGDSIKVTVIASAIGPYAVTGQYSWAQAV